LLSTLDALGVAGEEVAVAPGYARNFLVPQRRAVYATARSRAALRVELRRAARGGGAQAPAAAGVTGGAQTLVVARLLELGEEEGEARKRARVLT
jgi:large subunit ribosomal protein L9